MDDIIVLASTRWKLRRCSTVDGVGRVCRGVASANVRPSRPPRTLPSAWLQSNALCPSRHLSFEIAFGIERSRGGSWRALVRQYGWLSKAMADSAVTC